MKYGIEILFENEAFLIVSKPPDVLTIPDRSLSDRPSVAGELTKLYGKIFIVHRLDRETSGILCFAKTEAAHRHLSMQFEHKTVQKIYIALLDGIVHADEIEVEKPIGEHPSIAGKMSISRAGKPSLTIFRTIEKFKNFTLVEADIKTGRTHQIRIHAQSIGYPLAVDPMYGRRDTLLLSEIKQKRFKIGKYTDELPIMTRNTLHAYRLVMQNPDTLETMTFICEPPKDFRALLTQLRKWGKANV